MTPLRVAAIGAALIPHLLRRESSCGVIVEQAAEKTQGVLSQVKAFFGKSAHSRDLER